MSLHPREAAGLQGVEAQAEALVQASERGRLHHAWLLTGPEGVGKASFAYRAARWLLGAKPDPAHGALGTSPDDPVFRMIAAQSHPDLLVLERPADKKAIPVEEARRLPEFFAKAPALAPYRVAIIDAADDLNLNSANAVLKTLEEPPPRGVLFLVAHAPGRLLATIRSRCRRLAFPAWDPARLAAFLEASGTAQGEAAVGLAEMAGGAPGRALRLASQDALALDGAAQALLARLPEADEAGLVALADGFRGVEGGQRLQLFLERLTAGVRKRALATAGDAPDPGVVAWAEAWRRVRILAEETEALNLDRADSLWTALATLREAARTRPFA